MPTIQETAYGVGVTPYLTFLFHYFPDPKFKGVWRALSLHFSGSVV
jgi:hypothetical protein